MSARIIDLDAPLEKATTVVVRYKGVMTPVSRDRLLELLTREEQGFLTALGNAQAGNAGSGAVTSPQRAQPLPVPPDPSLATSGFEGGPLSHASISTRIRKIYSYSVGTQSVRPTHAGLLAEVLAAFDWQIPPHPNTHLEQHLSELRTWQGVTAALRADIEHFLARYAAARRRPAS